MSWVAPALGAGGHSVRLNGKVFEAVAACCARRSRRDLYHSALEVTGRDGRFTIEMTPIPDDGHRRAEGCFAGRESGLALGLAETSASPGGRS